MASNREYYRSDFLSHEFNETRKTMENETAIYVAVSTGNIEMVKELCNKNTFTDQKGVGVLSDNPVRNMRYHFVISTAMIARFCIKNGLIQDKAYGMSDYYIRKMDLVKTIDEIDKIHSAMCYDFCEAMQNLKTEHVISRSIVLTLDYISSHIHGNILLSELAENVNLSENYLSRLFAKEMNITIHDYINRMKIEKARNLLCYSDYSIIDIANYLAFSSQSHFITIFKKYEGITPHKYRNLHFREGWSTK